MNNVRDFKNLSKRGYCKYLKEELRIDWNKENHGYDDPRKLAIQANTLLYNISLYDQNTGWIIEKVVNGEYRYTIPELGVKLVPNKDWDNTKINYAIFFPCAQKYTFIAVTNKEGIIERFLCDRNIKKYIDEDKMREITYSYLKCPEASYKYPEIYRKGQLDWLKEVGILEPDEDLDPHILDNVYVFGIE